MTSKIVYQLCYISRAKNGISEAEIQDILKVARSYNKANDLSGILLFHAGIFIQLLEGRREIVSSLYEKICKDPRHDQCVFVFGIEKNPRLFTDWDMAYKVLGILDISFVNQILSWNQLIHSSGEIENDLIYEMLKSLQKRIT